MKGTVKYLLAISLLSSVHLFGAAKNAAFDNLFNQGVLKEALKPAPKKVDTADNFSTDLAVQAHQLATVLYFSDGIDDKDSPQGLKINETTCNSRTSWLKALETFCTDEFRTFKQAYKTFAEEKSSDNRQALVNNYLGTNGNDEAGLNKKYADVEPSTTNIKTIASFIELMTLYTLAHEKFDQSHVEKVIATKFSGPRSALFESTLESLFKEDKSENFWKKQKDLVKKSTRAAKKAVTTLTDNITSQEGLVEPSKEMNDKEFSQIIRKTARFIVQAIDIDSNLLKQEPADKKALQEAIEKLHKHVGKITTALSEKLSKGTEAETTAAALAFIQEFTGKKDTDITQNLTAYLKPFQGSSEKTATTAENNEPQILAELYFIAGTVPGVTLATIQPTEGGTLKLADKQYGSKMRTHFFLKHASTQERVENYIKQNPRQATALGVGSIAALAAITTGATAYYKGKKNGLGFVKTLKNMFGLLSAEDKTEIARNYSAEQIKKLCYEKTAGEIIAIKKMLTELSE